MSDPQPPAPGWWQAPDGGWHPPRPPDEETDQPVVDAPPASDDRRTWIIVAACVALILMFVAFSASKDDDERSTGSTPRSIDLSVQITYHVYGSATSASVTYETPTGSSQGETDLPMKNKSGALGLSMTFSPGDFVYISAQNSGSSGSVTCQIKDDTGRIISENTASGAYTIAQCDGTA